MSQCSYESWKIRELVDALDSSIRNGKKVIVPIFQRGKRWGSEDEKKLYDTLNKGLPFGTMLFYKKQEKSIDEYLLIDGLQRSNTIKKYLNDPIKYFEEKDIPEKLIEDIYTALGINGNSTEIKQNIANSIVDYIKKQKDLANIQYSEYADLFDDEYISIEKDTIRKITAIITPFLEKYKNQYIELESLEIPIIVYKGDYESLPEVFTKINKSGKALSPYEIFAASWPKDKTIVINDEKIIDYVLKKYDLLIDDNYAVDGYSREQKRTTKTLTAFEYAYGLGKYLVEKYEILQFTRTKKERDQNPHIEPIGFEILNACLNDNHKDLEVLYKKILDIDINEYTQRLIEVIEFVNRIIHPVYAFKGNTRGQNKTIHSKYQIISIISSTFREKYYIQNLTKSKRTWDNNRIILKQNILPHYIFDIIEDNWHDGGQSKIHANNKDNKYLNKIPLILWENTLDGWFHQGLQNKKEKHNENSKIAFLNCVYLSLFTSNDQLSDKKFDIEHIAPIKQMEELIKKIHSPGLNISSIANLCYLPEKMNRGKKDKTIYEVGYNSNEIDEIENKYSFTQERDLDWLTVLDYDYEDYDVLENLYHKYLTDRFEKQKEIFLKNTNIK